MCASWLLLSQCFSRTIICGRFSWPGSDDGAIYDAASWSLGKPQGVLIARTFNWMTRLIKDNARHYGFCRDSDACPPVVWTAEQHANILPACTMVID